MIALEDTLRLVAALLAGLLLGSVLPADLLAKRRGIDIRSSGDGNPGTVNAIHVLGWVPGLITAAYDTTVGILAIQIARLLGVSEGSAYLAGIMAVVGHRWPVFRKLGGGGQGMGAAAGLVVYGVAIALSRGWLPVLDLVGLAVLMLVTFVWTRSDKIVAIVILPTLVLRLSVAPTGWQFLAFVTVVAAHIWAVQLAAIRHRLPEPLHQ
jgi:acyl phosphate:glycerol-3-phosphate acyltransferase